MGLPSPTVWKQFSALRQRLESLSPADRRAKLRALRTDSADEAEVVSLLALHFAMPAHDSKSLRSGDRIDDVILGEVLGAGGMGVVHEAVQDLGAGGRPVAVKLINPLLWRTAPDEARRRFFDEIRAQAVLQYNGLARLYQAGKYTDPVTDDEAPYLVMELVRGARPITAFAEEQELNLEERLVLLQQVCRAVQHAHDHRIIHRDLKPANILIDSDGRPLVVDFGLAQTCDAILPGGTMVASGTPAYMSPEQLSDAFGAVSEKTDTYALGVVLYELLTGRVPYETSLDDSLQQLQHVVTKVAAAPLSEHDSALGGELEQIVTIALSKSPGERMTVGALGSRLSRYLLHQRQAQDAADARVAAVGDQRQPWRLPALIVGALMLATASVVYVLQQTVSPDMPASPLAAPGQTAEPGSIAVLPLQHLGGDKGDDIFTEGLHIDLISQLARIPALKVTPRAYVLGYEEKGMSPAHIARELGVSALVEGSVRIAGDRVRISIELHDPMEQQLLWSNSFDRTLTARNLFGVQAEVVRAIADGMGAALSPNAVEQVDRIPTESTEAYRAYQLALRYREKHLHAEQIKSLDEAIELDPAFAEAHADRAIAFFNMIRFNSDLVTQSEALEQARMSIDAAFALNPQLAAAYAANGLLYAQLGKPHLARTELEKAVKLEPRVEAWRRYLGWQYFSLGTNEQVLENLLAAFDMVPVNRRGDSWRHHPNIIMLLLSLGRLDEARLFIDEHIRLHPAAAYSTIALQHLDFGNNAEVIVGYEQMLKTGVALDSFDYGNLASAFVALGNYDAAADWIRKGLAQSRNHYGVCLIGGHALQAAPAPNHRALAERCAEIVIQSGGWCAFAILARRDHRKGAHAETVQRYREHLPELFQPDPKPITNLCSVWDAIGLAQSLQLAGDDDRASLLFENILQSTKEKEDSPAPFIRAVALAINHHEEKSIDALREAIARKSLYWWRPATTWPGVFDETDNNPDYSALQEAYEQEMTRQRQRLEILRSQKPTLQELGDLLFSNEGNQLSDSLADHF